MINIGDLKAGLAILGFIGGGSVIAGPGLTQSGDTISLDLAYADANIVLGSPDQVNGFTIGVNAIINTRQNTSFGVPGLTSDYKISSLSQDGNFTSYLTNVNTASRIYTFQNRDGTILDDTDLAGITTALSNKLSLSGGTLTGNLILNADPTNALGAVTKQYADALVVGLLDDRGNYDASSNLWPSSGGSGTAGAILKGDLWYISVAGTLGGTAVYVGYSIRALVDSPGQTAANWDILSSGLGYIPENVANKSTSTSLGTSDTLYPSQNAVKSYADTALALKAPLASPMFTGIVTMPALKVDTISEKTLSAGVTIGSVLIQGDLVSGVDTLTCTNVDASGGTITGLNLVGDTLTAQGSNHDLSLLGNGSGNPITSVSRSGVAVKYSIINTSNTASSGAQLLLQVAGATAEDPKIVWTINGVKDWSAGPDNSDGDAWVLAASANLGTTNIIRADTNGLVKVGAGSDSFSEATTLLGVNSNAAVAFAVHDSLHHTEGIMYAGNAEIVLGAYTNTLVNFKVNNTTVFSMTTGGNLQFNNSANFTANSTRTVTISNVGPASISATIAKWFTFKDAGGVTSYMPVWQ